MKKQRIDIDSPEYRDILYKLQNTKISLPPLRKYSKTLTEVKDIDLLILAELDDNDLFNICLVNKYANKLCQNEEFWKERFMKKFGSTAQKHSSRFKFKNISWRNTYLKMVRDLEFFSNQPWEIFNFISYNVKSDELKISSYINDQYIIKLPKDDESFLPLKNSTSFAQNNFWLTNLGNEMTLRFLPYGIEIIREYKKDYDFFTPEQVIDIIREFYREPATLAEYEAYKKRMEEIDEETRYKKSDIEKKRVRRVNLILDGDFKGIDNEKVKTVHIQNF